ncbi:transcription factor bHLH112-like isoform X2 [Olea europaea var. sylvestris]|uniref:transcription factor bHLH112-like isoform X2 n=1 Tax=Olea europaea var. sylvestris TaxID=158386 RepID=UPI000C1D5D48|nr:transcription factor bHLH112-like isoform X2 [Olea europaea var. sylvestris]
MAEDLHDGGNWCCSSRIALGSSPCSLAINGVESFGWPSDHHMMNMKTTGSGDNESGSASDGSIVLQEMQKPDSILEMMGITLSPSTATDNWNQDLLNANGNSQENYSHMLQQDLNSSVNCLQQFGVDCCQIHKDWNSRNISGVVEDLSINSIKQMNHGFEEPLASITSSNISTETSRSFSTCLPLNSASYGYTSAWLESLLNTDSQPQQSLLKNSNMNFRPTNSLQLSKNTPPWTAAAAVASNDTGNFFPSTKSQFLPSALDTKLNLPNLAAKANKTARDLNSITNKSCNEPTFKRPRLETPSPLPTFKVRKEKLGDRITALQQLVSPFGKTDTASVLQEAIEYIKFLHDQVLIAPYKTNVPPVQRQQTAGKLKNQEGSELNLKSRGLCLVPISSTFLISAENTSDFWTPTFGERFR